MKKISLVYISLSGNTESFVTRLKAYLLEQYANIEVEKIHIKDLVKEGEDFFEMTNPYVAFLPTYLEGGNGVDSGDVEILTNDLAKFIDFEKNYKKCFGFQENKTSWSRTKNPKLYSCKRCSHFGKNSCIIKTKWDIISHFKRELHQ